VQNQKVLDRFEFELDGFVEFPDRAGIEIPGGKVK